MGTRIGLGVNLRDSQGFAPASGPPEPEEFITNGAFAADTDWTKGLGWTIGGGVADQDGSSDQELSQNFGALTAALVNGNNYVLTFDLTNGDVGLVTCTIGTQAVLSTFSQGAINQPFTADGNHATIAFRSLEGAAIIVDNVSLVPA